MVKTLTEEGLSRLAEREILTTGDVASTTGWTIGKVRRLCESGKLPAVDTSTGSRPRWSIRRCDLDEFLTPATKRRSQSESTADQREPSNA